MRDRDARSGRIFPRAPIYFCALKFPARSAKPTESNGGVRGGNAFPPRSCYDLGASPAPWPPPPRGQDELGVAVGLAAPWNTRSQAAWKATPSKPGAIGVYSGSPAFWPVHHRGHAAQRLHHLRLGARCRGAASWRCAGRRCAASRGPPSARHRGCPAPWSSRRPGRSSAPRSRGCPGRCCPARPAHRPAPSWCSRPAGWSAGRRAWRAAPPARSSSCRAATSTWW